MSGFGCVVITADDANFCRSVDDAVLDLVDAGVVTNVAAFANSVTSFDFEACHRHGATIGAHLNLTSGAPISSPEFLQTLLNESNKFISPMSLIKAEDESLFDAIERHQKLVVSQYSMNEVVTELNAQLSRLRLEAGVLNGWHSFHQDLDILDQIAAALGHVKSLPSTRVRNQRIGVLSGSNYELHQSEISADEAFKKTVSMIEAAVEKSAKVGGAPFEIALHPAKNLSGLSDFTAYSTQRLLEFEIWMSDDIRKIVSSGVRRGNTISFPVKDLRSAQ
jgi:predicted glycoside hydrolase/deacetylase ChbG (UPF0249 family)